MLGYHDKITNLFWFVEKMQRCDRYELQKASYGREEWGKTAWIPQDCSHCAFSSNRWQNPGILLKHRLTICLTSRLLAAWICLLVHHRTDKQPHTDSNRWVFQSSKQSKNTCLKQKYIWAEPVQARGKTRQSHKNPRTNPQTFGRDLTTSSNSNECFLKSYSKES